MLCVTTPGTADTVVVAPGPGITVATEVLLLLHVPPGVPLLSVALSPEHNVVVPEIGVGKGFTVTTVDAVHAVPNIV